MRHVPEGVLRRLVDEPSAVPDRQSRHVERCQRCRARLSRVESDASYARRLFSPVELVGRDPRSPRAPTRTDAKPIHLGARRHWRLLGGSISTGTTIAAVCLVIAGVAAGATLTTVFAPTQVTPSPVSQGDVQQLTSLLGLNGGTVLDGFGTPSGTTSFPYGTLTWRTSGKPESVPSLASAESTAGFAVVLPSSLPGGVGTPPTYRVLPTLTATVSFNSVAGPALAGSSLVMSAGPGIEVAYPGGAAFAGVSGLPSLALLDTPRPVVTSTGATTSALEGFLLSRHGVPANLSAEVRLLGDLSSALPVPTPQGVSSSAVDINGAKGVLVSDDGNTASLTIWEDQAHMVHVVAGLLDSQGVLGVARQVG